MTEIILIAGAGFVAYKLLAKPIEKIGGDVSGAIEGVTAPFQFAGTAAGALGDTFTARQRTIRQSYQDPQVVRIITQTTTAQESSNLQRALRTTYETTQRTAFAKQSMETTSAALRNNYPEQVARKTEYGASVGEYLQKVFMPTQQVAQVRQSSLRSTVSGAASAVKSGASSIISSIKSIFTPKKPATTTGKSRNLKR